MRRNRKRAAEDWADRDGNGDRVGSGDRRRIFANGWPVVPLRLFLGALFCFAGYAKLSYPGFFDPNSTNGFKAAVDAARDGTPLGGALSPLADHPSLFGHITAYAEIAIGLGLLVGLLARVAALGGMVLTTMILLSIDWNGVKEYTGSSGWFTAVDLAIAAALSVFLLGGAGPLALDNLFIRAKERQRARDDAEPSFRDSDLESSRRRLQGEPVAAAGAGTGAGTATAQVPPGDRGYQDHETRDQGYQAGNQGYQTGNQAHQGGNPGYQSGYRTSQQDEEYRDDPEPEPNSLWTQGRRTPEDQPTTEQRRTPEQQPTVEQRRMPEQEQRRSAEPSGPADR